MLVLSRKRDESIVIKDNIVVTVIEIRKDRVRLGIDAPKAVTVHRHEVYEAIKRQDSSPGTQADLPVGNQLKGASNGTPSSHTQEAHD
jgi:carbon storage regulator